MYKLFVSLLLLILIGCSSEGDIKIINRTEHNLYFSISSNNYILEGSSDSNPSETISIETGRYIPILENDQTKVNLHLEGETFMMQEASQGTPLGIFYTDTSLYLKPNETLKIYCDPTHAGVKLINNSQLVVNDFYYYTQKTDSLVSLLKNSIQPADSAWSRLKASTQQDSLIYSFLIEFENGYTDSSYQNIESLTVDEQLLIDFQ